MIAAHNFRNGFFGDLPCLVCQIEHGFVDDFQRSVGHQLVILEQAKAAELNPTMYGGAHWSGSKYLIHTQSTRDGKAWGITQPIVPAVSDDLMKIQACMINKVKKAAMTSRRKQKEKMRYT